MECSSCGNEKATFCEERATETCKDCCLKGGGNSCFWFRVCWG